MPLRFLFVAPLAFIALTFFGLHFAVMNSRLGDTPMRYVSALTFGLMSGITNVLWNIFGATFVFWQLPPWRNDSGEISPMFTTRIKKRLADGHRDPMTMWFVWAVNTYDPDHFEVTS